MLERVDIGKIVNTVGLRGEVKLLPGPDFWPGALETASLYLDVPGKGKRPFRVERFRKKKGTFILKIDILKSIEEAEGAVGGTVEIAIGDLEESEYPEETMGFQLVDMSVFLKDDTYIGEVEELIKGNAQDQLIIRGEGRNYIIPLVPEIVIGIDYEEGRIELDPPKGLLDLDW